MAEEINQSDAASDAAATAFMGVTAAGHGARFDRVDWLSLAITSLLALAVYLFTLAPDVTLEDSGMLATGAFYGGVVEPPGYPLWTIYSWLLTGLLPFSNIAWRVSAGSAVAAALASGIVALIVSYAGRLLMEDSAGFEHLTSRERRWLRMVCGYVAGLALGLSGVVWRKAVIADIWTLSLVLFTAILCLSLRWMMEPGEKRFLCAGFLLLGLLLTGRQEMLVTLPGLVYIAMLGNRNLGRDLALTVLPLAAILTTWNHFGVWIDFPRYWSWPLLMMFSAVAAFGLAIVVSTRRFGSTWKFTLLCHISFFLGLWPCLYLPLASMSNPPMDWGYARTVKGFFHVVSRAQYERFHPTGDLGGYANQLWMFLKMSGKEFGWMYLFLAALPLCLILSARQRERKWLFALVMMFVCAGPVLVAELNPSADRMSEKLTMSYFMPSFAALSILVGIALLLSIRLVRMSKR
jgi:hypothetical protein